MDNIFLAGGVQDWHMTNYNVTNTVAGSRSHSYVL